MKKVININTFKLFTDITATVAAMTRDWAKSGLVHIYSAHTTSCIRVLEKEILSFADIRFWLDKYTPKDKPENRRYLHDLISLREDVDQDERVNGFAHMRSLFFNTSETIPVAEGRIAQGKWQSIIFVELDPGDGDKVKTKDRELIVTFIEE